tara:strand:- start:12604 stop:13611 length:1008 start_codon:yes stop_codon:yes gene_type:complete
MKTHLIKQVQHRMEKSSLPSMVILDITNTCNLKCIHCPQPIMQAKPGFKPQYFEFDWLKKVVDEIAESKQSMLLRIAGDGEPTIHPRLVEMVNYAKKNSQAVVNLTTNGLLVGQEVTEALLKADIDLVDFSIDAYSKDVFEEVRRGGNYQKLMRNIFGFVERRNALRKKTKVMVSFVAQKENQHEVQEFRKFWSPIVDRVLIRQLHSALGQAKEEESKELNDADNVRRFPCPHLWKRLTIDYKGNIKFCAHDWFFDAETTLAQIQNAGMGETWRGKKLAKLREFHTTNNFPPNSICGNCNDWASTRWDYGYERLIDKVVFKEPILIPELPIDGKE